MVDRNLFCRHLLSAVGIVLGLVEHHAATRTAVRFRWRSHTTGAACGSQTSEAMTPYSVHALPTKPAEALLY
jgi:hypothetical protein